MRVAIFEPEIGARGPVAGAFSIRDGLRGRDHHADVVTFTKSGKPRSSWGADAWKISNGLRFWGTSPDVVGTFESAVAVLDSYDVILLPEPKQALHDKEAVKTGTLPEYVKALQQTRTPWTAGLFAPQYTPEATPFLPTLLETKSFCGALITYNHEIIKCNPLLEQVPLYFHPMPYQPTWAEDAPIPITAIVGMTGRIISNKGQQLLLHAAPEVVRDPWRIELWGSPSVAGSACFTYQLYEHLTEKCDAIKVVEPLRVDKNTNQVIKDVIQPKRWEVRSSESGPSIGFMGGYTDVHAVYDRIGVHVDLTADTYSQFLEYTQFEAIDAGCLLVSVSHMSDSRFRMWTFDMHGAVPGPAGLMKGKQAESAEHLKAALVSAMATVGTDTHREIAAHNRRMLRELHDPARCGELSIAVALRGRDAHHTPGLVA